ncbi:MAG: glycerophosphodiester phosphodiesterase family protein [Bacteroidaceae bacterium]
MRRLFFFGCFFSFALLALAETHVEKLIRVLNNPKSKKVFVVAHRGDWRNAPENSLQAFQNCIDMGVDMIELDVHMSKDSVLFLMHDNTVDRTTNGHGKVSDLTSAELKNLRLKAGHGIVTNHHIPTFEEALILCKGKILINVDKGYDYFKEVYRIMEKTGTTNQVVIKSGKPIEKVLKENSDVVRKSIYMPIIGLESSKAEAEINDLSLVKPVAVECCFGNVNDQVLRLMNLIKENGSKLWINSLWPSLNGGHDDDRAVEANEPDEAWGWILEQGALLIQTDRPAQLLRYLKKHKRH